MSEREKKIVESLAEAMNILPEGKKEFLMGYAEGVAAMAGQRAAKPEEQSAPGEKPGAGGDEGRG